MRAMGEAARSSRIKGLTDSTMKLVREEETHRVITLTSIIAMVAGMPITIIKETITRAMKKGLEIMAAAS